MKLLEIAGLSAGAVETIDGAGEGEQLTALLTRVAVGFLEAGGHVSLAEWSELSPRERAALAAAGRMLRHDQAVKTGLASQGDLAALRVHAEIDGGEAHDDALLSTAVRSLTGTLAQAREAQARGAQYGS